MFVFYIQFNEMTLQGNVIQLEDEETEVNNFIYIHNKTTPIKDTDNSLIYSLQMNGKPNYKRKLLSNATFVESQITKYFATDKVFYQNNEICEIVRNYLMASARSNIIT